MAAHSSMASIPATMSAKPRAERQVNFSWNITRETATVESVFRMPHLARIAVMPAKKAEPSFAPPYRIASPM